MMIRGTLIVVAALGTVGAELAHADTRSTFRLGVMPLDLESSSETPLFGGTVVKAVDDYNTAAAIYDQRTGAMTERIDTSDLGVSETLLVFAPGVELGGGGLHFYRLELPIGIGDELRSFGLGFYPINLQAPLGSVAVYGSLGGSASWLDRAGSGDVGALVTLRAAAGFRLASHVVFEVGYNAY